MRNPQTLYIKTIDGDWCDKDAVILHACFQLLTNFVEEEISKDIVDWEHDEYHKAARKEIDELYLWWKNRVIQDVEGNLDPVYDDIQYQTDNEMLIRLINIRRYLWT